ncbi:MAG TPA: SMC-Scp complex subunit ScpB [Bacteriovoracaceae bacterium]|nr:SMC-Scp complex subunit ScpB [Bacteriovoracaceae bacterium]
MDDINFKWDLSVEDLEPIDLETAENEEVKEQVEEEAEAFSLDVSFFDEKSQEDMLWQARTGLNPETLCGAIETIIFMSDKPVSIQKIKTQIDPELPLRVIHESLSRLQGGYEEKHHGIRLVEVAEGYQFRTKATYSKFVLTLFKINSLVLTPTALEVLAIIAYKQPVSKNDVEKIRGVDSSHIIRALMDKRLLKITGRSEELGRPSLFGTTEEFLEVFNLPNISALPPEFELEEMATKNTVGTIADIKSVVFRGEGKKFGLDEFEELDKLSEDIHQIASDTSFTMLLKSEEKKKIDGETTIVRKSAFDILEEFVNREASLRQNLAAINSDTLMNIVEPKVVDISQDVVFNAPEDTDEEFEALRAKDIADVAADELEREAMELENALDFAFEQLTGEKLEDGEMEFEVEGEIDNLESSIDEAVTKGKDFGLDLGFLNEVSLPDNESDDV